MDRTDKTNLVDVAQDDFLHCVVLQHLTNDPTVSTTNDKHILRVRMAGHWKMCNHFLVTRNDRCRSNQ